MKTNLIKLITNANDQYVASVNTYDTSESAKVAYHQNLASLHNAADVKIAVVKLEDEYGHEVPGFYEVVDHTEPIEE